MGAVVIDPLEYVHESFEVALRHGLINTIAQLMQQKLDDDKELQKALRVEEDKDVGFGSW